MWIETVLKQVFLFLKKRKIFLYLKEGKKVSALS